MATHYTRLMCALTPLTPDLNPTEQNINIKLNFAFT